MRQLFCFFQFNGDNADWCNLHCPYCYAGPTKRMEHKWNGRVEDWGQGFQRLNRNIYFNLSYGESMGSRGFPEVIDLIGRHENWECNIITNLSISPEQLVKSTLAQHHRLYMTCSWHPMGGGDWEKFKKHLLILQEAEVPTVVMYLFYPPQIYDWKLYWRWLDDHNIRTHIRRFVGYYHGEEYPRSYSPDVKAFLYAQTQPKTQRYGLELKSPQGLTCTASKDMILVHYDGQVSYCADVPGNDLGNIFDVNFKLSEKPIKCPSHVCGGDYGLLHFHDDEFGPPDAELWHDSFVAQVERITGGGKEPVQYPNRAEMEKWLNAST